MIALGIRRQIKSIKQSVTPKYTMRTVSLPQAIVNVALPASTSFYFDDRFTQAEVSRIMLIISSIYFIWSDYYESIDNELQPKLETCANRYSKFNLAPAWFEGKITSPKAATALLMDTFTTMFAANGFNRASLAYIRYEIPNSGKSTIRGLNGSNPEKNSLSVTINPKMIDRKDLTEIVLSGSLFHAWMHRAGYLHPPKKYTSYLSGEIAMCVMRGFKNKTPGQNDSVYTTFLD